MLVVIKAILYEGAVALRASVNFRKDLWSVAGFMDGKGGESAEGEDVLGAGKASYALFAWCDR